MLGGILLMCRCGFSRSGWAWDSVFLTSSHADATGHGPCFEVTRLSSSPTWWEWDVGHTCTLKISYSHIKKGKEDT